MSTLLPVVVAGSMLALIMWYLRRPPERLLRLASAKYLPTLTRGSQAPIQPSFKTLLRSRWLWLRLALLALIAVPFMLAAEDPTVTAKPRLGVRIILDVSASMDIEGPEGTRLAEGLRLARELLAKVDAYRAEADVCVSAALVDAGVRAVEPAALDVEAAKPRAPTGALGWQLVAQALVDVRDCPPTHVVVISDLGKHESETPDGRIVLWWQVGAPKPNIGLGAVDMVVPFGAAPSTVSVVVHRVGGARAPSAVRIIGPDRDPHPANLPDWSLPESTVTLSFVATKPGRYVIELEGGGAFTGDDRLTIDVPPVVAPTFEWRLDIPAPRGLQLGSGPESILVAPISMIGEVGSRRAVLALGPLAERLNARRLGLFLSEDPLLADLNLEVLDRSAPAAVTHPLGNWIAVVREENANLSSAGVLVARRVTPRGAIVPAPPRSRSSLQVTNAGEVLLFNAMRYVAQDHRPPLAVRRTTAADVEVPGADLETNTAIAVNHEHRHIAVAPIKASKPMKGRPLWPWVVVGLLILLIGERYFGMSRRLQ